MAHLYHNDLLAPYLALPQGDKIQAECRFSLFLYPPAPLTTPSDVWIDGDDGLRSKTTVSRLLLQFTAL